MKLVFNMALIIHRRGVASVRVAQLMATRGVSLNLLFTILHSLRVRAVTHLGSLRFWARCDSGLTCVGSGSGYEATHVAPPRPRFGKMIWFHNGTYMWLQAQCQYRTTSTLPLVWYAALCVRWGWP